MILLCQACGLQMVETIVGTSFLHNPQFNHFTVFTTEDSIYFIPGKKDLINPYYEIKKWKFVSVHNYWITGWIFTILFWVVGKLCSTSMMVCICTAFRALVIFIKAMSHILGSPINRPINPAKDWERLYILNQYRPSGVKWLICYQPFFGKEETKISVGFLKSCGFNMVSSRPT